MKFYLSESLIVPGTKGLFAGNDIKEGTVLFIDFEKTGNDGKFFEADYRQSEQSKLINSSHNPNTSSKLSDHDRKIIRVASRIIKEDEELIGDDSQIKEIIQTLGYK
ncbi:MAG: hypothetical protein K0S32_678 [Bacteroidetes bacterium]|jgi:hypothetical protein|nr:hypothetical protein [Bacteroidota bacterium]